MSIPVSTIVMTKNEQANIAACLDRLAAFDEVFVVDSGSTDETVRIARDAGATVVPFSWDGKYPKKKQWCLENLPFRNEWVLYVDGDEFMTPALGAEIEATVAATSYAGFFVDYDYVFLGRVLRHGRRVSKLVLLRHRDAAFAALDDLSAPHAGEVELHYQPRVRGTVGRLENRMTHDDHDTLFHYFDRQNRYTDWEAVVRTSGELLQTGEASIGGRIALKRLFYRLPAKGLVAFLNSYVLRLGFLDGRAGFHYALSLGCYYWQVALKQGELRDRRRETGDAPSRVDLREVGAHDGAYR